MLALGAVNSAGLDFMETGNKFMRRRLSGELHTQVMAALEKEAMEAQQRLTTSHSPEPDPEPEAQQATCSGDGCEVNIGSTEAQQDSKEPPSRPPPPPAVMKQPPNMFSVVKNTDTAVAAATSTLLAFISVSSVVYSSLSHGRIRH